MVTCPVCGTPHAIVRLGPWMYLRCPRVTPGTMVEVEHPFIEAMVRRATAAWN